MYFLFVVRPISKSLEVTRLAMPFDVPSTGFVRFCGLVSDGGYVRLPIIHFPTIFLSFVFPLLLVTFLFFEIPI